MDHKQKLNLIFRDDENKRKPKMKLYIAGKITGCDISLTLKKFVLAQIEMEEYGHEVIIPFHNKLGEVHSWKEHMSADLKLILGCDAIAFLPDWKESRGARIEYWFAKRYGKVIYFLEDI